MLDYCHQILVLILPALCVLLYSYFGDVLLLLLDQEHAILYQIQPRFLYHFTAQSSEGIAPKNRIKIIVPLIQCHWYSQFWVLGYKP